MEFIQPDPATLGEGYDVELSSRSSCWSSYLQNHDEIYNNSNALLVLSSFFEKSKENLTWSCCLSIVILRGFHTLPEQIVEHLP